MTTIVCLGDSLTEGADLDEAARWPALVGHALNLDVINCGIGGDTTAGMLSRFYPEVVNRTPALVLLMGGTNDLWFNVPVESITANIFAMVCQARYHGITPLVGLPLPIQIEAARQQAWEPPVGGYAQCTKGVAALGQNIKRYAISSEVTVLDFYQAFMGVDARVNPDLYLEDGTHANAAGHHCMAQVAIDLLKQQYLFGAASQVQAES